MHPENHPWAEALCNDPPACLQPHFHSLLRFWGESPRPPSYFLSSAGITTLKIPALCPTIRYGKHCLGATQQGFDSTPTTTPRHKLPKGETGLWGSFEHLTSADAAAGTCPSQANSRESWKARSVWVGSGGSQTADERRWFTTVLPSDPQAHVPSKGTCPGTEGPSRPRAEATPEPGRPAHGRPCPNRVTHSPGGAPRAAGAIQH